MAGRIKRDNAPAQKIRRNHLRSDALPPLLKDFKQRCAYCQNHSDYVGGDQAFEIDHFHPHTKGGHFTDYDNLFLSCRQCNKHKWDFWPSKEEQRLGARFLDCTKEMDYGEHLFEDDKGSIVPVSKPGTYHSRILKLNRHDLVRVRQKRTALIKKLCALRGVDQMNLSAEDINEVTNDIQELIDLIDHLIPWIAPPPTV